MRIIGTVSVKEIYLKIPVLFHVWHSSVFFFLPHCIYLEFFGVFELFSPVHTKTPKQWKNNGNTMYGIIVFNNLRFRPFTRKRQAGVFFQTPFWGPFLMPGNTVYMLAAGKLNGEKKSVLFQKYPVTCRQGLR